ncbi:MAG: 1-deoxy-D-xylulose-5-phosphate synthase [Firmicutes bacterium]|nr:1-deoxy-D-xylulose-5-phosphate synthase [Bacillota bacterium]
MSNYLKRHDFPSELKNMTYEELELLSYEIRDFLVDSVSRTGGHLASSLGVVELAIVLHRVFDSPKDKLIWDVGHQSYVHKILTGRAEGFEHLRQMGGMSGFPKRCESEHDVFDTGHSSTSIGLGLGMAAARDLKGEDYRVVSVIGDGALTGGLAFEALNHAGHLDTDLIVVLNDNGMSISPNIGGLSRHLVRLSGTAGYSAMKNRIKTGVSKVPVIGDDIVSGLQHAKEKIKYSVLEDGVIFEELGFKYIGPVDGHDIRQLCEVLENASRLGGPVLIHTLTTKGKGYSHAEKDPGKFHGIGPFDVSTGKPLKSGASDSWSDVFGDKLVRMAFQNPKIIAVSAAMIEGTGLSAYSRTFPKRIFDVGIAEEHGVTFSAGMAAAGMKPFVAIYSTFLQRAYDQIMEEVCLQGLPVVFCLDRAGVVGADGETHHGIFDLSYLRSMPGMTILAPASARQLEEMMDFAASCEGPCAIRYPRGKAEKNLELAPFECGKAERIREGSDVDLWAEGPMLASAVKASEILEQQGIHAGVVNIASIQPLDEKQLRESAREHPMIVTIEDNVISGGIGEHMDRLLTDDPVHIVNLGWPDQFVPHGTQEELYEAFGLDGASIARRVMEERTEDRK